MSDLQLFHGPNAGYALELYERFLRDPESVDPATRDYFQRHPLPDETPEGTDELPVFQPIPLPNGAPVRPQSEAPPQPGEPGQPLSEAGEAESDGALEGCDVRKIVAAARVVRLIREMGHHAARIDPLGRLPRGVPDLEIETHDLTESDLRRLPPSVVSGPLAEGAQDALEAIERLRRAYCGSIGYEDDHIQVNEERIWLRESAESGRYFAGITDDDKRVLLERLTQVEVFEQFLHNTFVGQKRFSLEGLDMLVPMIDEVIHGAAEADAREVLIGMAHRGRLNVLTHILGKPYASIFSEFVTASDEKPAVSGTGSTGWTGDVKYHLGRVLDYSETGEGKMPITLAPNPSHLEFVNPSILGRARAAQTQRAQTGPPTHDPRASGAILIHGDASFIGEGVVAETLNLSQLDGYTIGGSIHIILNNQVGFTTPPRQGRSTLYASDLAKGFEIPVVHVNADDPVACIAAIRMAYGYCQAFHKDFLIDLIGYRRWGHNEGDEPMFTQPRMYEIVSTHPTVRRIWAREMERLGLTGREEAEALVSKYEGILREARSEPVTPPEEIEFGAKPVERDRAVETAIPADRLLRLNEELLARPERFQALPKLERMLQRRRQLVQEPNGVDWSHGEALAFASILADGVPIRMTGQDIERGTFSQRHAVLHDPRTGSRFTPFQTIPSARASFEIHNSPLSEAAVLGFEYGYSIHARGTLVLWEAQFGDFINVAQVIIDQFLVSGKAKWRHSPSLVLLLPHGYEGQGPEHSSARLERFLQLAAGNNLRIVNPTTSAQYFHVLRRQVALLDSDPQPLVLLTPKSLLRHPRAASSLKDFTEGRFEVILNDPRSLIRRDAVTRLVLCSGKVGVDLAARGEWVDAEHVGLIRIEQLYPFPEEELRDAIAAYPNLREVFWLQEEPRNMGAWWYVRSRIRDLVGSDIVQDYVGRPEAASPAEGSLRQHNTEQARILSAVLTDVPEPTRQRREISHVR